uniref:Cadherin domain-containing protein n=1 Tax=Ascaris lumbricoides TaxID=6252 RepID=A0A0M3HUT7_ASCLU
MLCGAFTVIGNHLTDIVRTIILLTLLQKCAFSQLQTESQCFFPESEQHPFFFDIDDLEPIGTVIVDTVVEPPDARLSIGSIRSRNITTIDFNNRFTLRTDQNRFSLLLNDSVKLPPFPSIIRETYLYVTIICNQMLYPLITVRITHNNEAAPRFYGRQPYSIQLNKATAPGTIIETPVLAIDWDPSTRYSVSYDIVCLAFLSSMAFSSFVPAMKSNN